MLMAAQIHPMSLEVYFSENSLDDCISLVVQHAVHGDTILHVAHNVCQVNEPSRDLHLVKKRLS